MRREKPEVQASQAQASKEFQASPDPVELMARLVRRAQREVQALPEASGQPGLVDKLEVLVLLDLLALRASRAFRA